jgi:hypothetical protein
MRQVRWAGLVRYRPWSGFSFPCSRRALSLVLSPDLDRTMDEEPRTEDSRYIDLKSALGAPDLLKRAVVSRDRYGRSGAARGLNKQTFLPVPNLATTSALTDAHVCSFESSWTWRLRGQSRKSVELRSSCDFRMLSMKLGSVILALALLLPSVASAGPVTVGAWSQGSTADADLDSFWDGLSWDCPTCGAGYLLYSEYPALEYLHNGAGGFTAFQFDEATLDWTLEFSMTGWTQGVLGRRADGAFTYDSGTGRVSNSIDNPGQYALFRHVTPEWTEYYLAIEDILLDEPLNDRDYNDHVVSFTVPTQTVPEPSTLLLFALPALGMVGRNVRGRR